MKRGFAIKHEFVEFIPAERAERTLYISTEYATAVHNCFCGCGTKVVTPLGPTGWQLTLDGDAVSLRPSVGNWSFACRSHYWIRRSRVAWAGDMTQAKIDRGRARDRALRQAHYGGKEPVKNIEPAPMPAKKAETKPKTKGWFSRLFGSD